MSRILFMISAAVFLCLVVLGTTVARPRVQRKVNALCSTPRPACGNRLRMKATREDLYPTGRRALAWLAR